jgi:hypothetical protein
MDGTVRPAVAIVGERSIVPHRVVQTATCPPTQPVANPPALSLAHHTLHTLHTPIQHSFETRAIACLSPLH